MLIEVREQKGVREDARIAVSRLAIPIPAVILVALLFTYAACIFSTGIGLFHDDGIYVVTAKSIAEGHGYRIESLPEALGQTKYPPLLPMILAAIWKVFPNFPDNAPLLKMVSFGSLLAWAWTCFCFFRGSLQFSRPVALWLLIAVLAGQWTLFCSSAILTEHLYAALALGSLLVLSKTDTKSIFWAAALAGLAYLTRTTGATVVAAGLLALMAQKRWKHAAIFGAVAIPFVAGWMVWQKTHELVSADPIEAYYTAQNYTDWNLLAGSSFKAVASFIASVNGLWILMFPSRLLGLPFTLSISEPGLLLASLPVWYLCCRGILRAGRRKLALLLFAAGSLAILPLWAWLPDRFLLPLVPLFVGFIVAGLPQRFPTVALTPLLGLPLLKTALACGAILTLGVPAFAAYPWMAPPGRNVQASDWRKVTAVCDWIKNNTPSDAIVFANYDPLVYLYTGRHGIRPFPVDPGFFFYGMKEETAETTANFLKHAARYHPKYLIETGREADEVPNYSEVIKGLMERGVLKLAGDIGPGYRIYSVANP